MATLKKAGYKKRPLSFWQLKYFNSMNAVGPESDSYIYPNRTNYFKWILMGLLIIFISAFSSVLIITIFYKSANPPLTWLMVERYFFNEKTKFSPIQNQAIQIESVSPNMVLAAIAAEDNLFPTHRGFDFESIREAREQQIMGKRTRGASTISMQVSKNVFLWHGRTWTRKFLEAGFTVLIEAFWSKKRIMEVYLNIAEFGPAIYGIESASKAFFNKPSSKLTLNEAAMMATILPNPLLRNPTKPSNYMRNYQQRILRNMRNLGDIDLSNRAIAEKNAKSKK